MEHNPYRMGAAWDEKTTREYHKNIYLAKMVHEGRITMEKAYAGEQGTDWEKQMRLLYYSRISSILDSAATGLMDIASAAECLRIDQEFLACRVFERAGMLDFTLEAMRQKYITVKNALDALQVPTSDLRGLFIVWEQSRRSNLIGQMAMREYASFDPEEAVVYGKYAACRILRGIATDLTYEHCAELLELTTEQADIASRLIFDQKHMIEATGYECGEIHSSRLYEMLECWQPYYFGYDLIEFTSKLELFSDLQARGIITAKTAEEIGNLSGTQYEQAVERIREGDTEDLPME